MKRKLYRRLSLTPWPTHAWADVSQNTQGSPPHKGFMPQKGQQQKRQEIKKPSRAPRMSAYGRVLRTRRQLCMLYGNLRARTYRFLEERAYKTESLQVEQLFGLFERRLATCLLRTNCFASFEHIRALLRQGKIYVNGHKVYTPGYMCQPGDILSFPVTQLSERQKKGCFLGRPALHLEIDYSLGQAVVLLEPLCIELPASILALES